MTANTPCLVILTPVTVLDTVSPMKWPLSETGYWVRLTFGLIHTPFLMSLESMII